MSDSIFTAFSELSELEIPFKLKEDLLLEWLLELSNTESYKACITILRLLKTLNKTKLSAKTRFSFVKTIHEYLKNHIHNLDHSCWDASLPISAKEHEYAELVTWSYLSLTEAFFIAAPELPSRTDEMFALYMSCYCLGQAQIHVAAVYKTPDPFFWQLVYSIFAWVEKYGLFETKINDSDLKHITLNSMFAQLFIFQGCDTNQFRPRDMLTIFNFLPKVCHGFGAYKLSDVKFQTEVFKIPYLQAVANSFGDVTEKLAEKINQRHDLFVFDLNQSLPPAIFNQTYLLSTSSLRYFSITPVAENLERVVNEDGTWHGVLKSVNKELFARVIKTLEPGKKRKHTRSQTEHTMLGIIGFENIVSFLYKVGRKNIPKQNQSQDSKTDSSFSIATPEKNRMQMGAIDGGFAEINFAYQSTSGNSIWENKINLDIINKPVSLKRLTIFDHSVKGYLVYWADDESSKAKIGDIFAVVSDDKKRLEIAIIRRIAITSPTEYKFGTEVLGFESEVVLIADADNPTRRSWAIFIPAIKALKQVDSIIYPISNFHQGDVINMHKGNNTIKAAIGKQLNASIVMVHAELDYL